MPSSKQAAKRMRQDAKRKAASRARKTAIKTATKAVTKAVGEKNQGDAQGAFKVMQARLDKAAKTSTIHRNKAARRKSRVQKQINALNAS
jgi:small subunit ribosomal protein S20